MTTPGATATTLLPSSHCSRSASQASPPVVDDLQRRQLERMRHDLQERFALLRARRSPFGVTRLDDEGAQLVNDVGIDRHQIAIAEGEHGVEVHRAARLRQLRDEHLLRRAGRKQRLGQRGHALRRAALAHADEHEARRQRHHVAAFERAGVAPSPHSTRVPVNARESDRPPPAAASLRAAPASTSGSASRRCRSSTSCRA